MIHPIPPGTRDVLPDEMRELRALESTLRATFDGFGYGEVATPTIEYQDVLRRGTERGGRSAYRFFDEKGRVLALRSDGTIGIARLVSTRYPEPGDPLRLFYIANTYRAVRPQRGQQREFAQAGVELIGIDAPQGTGEVIEVLCAALDAAGLRRASIGLGDADLFRQLLVELDVDAEARRRVLSELVTHDFVGLEREVAALDLPSAEREALITLPRMRGGPEILDAASAMGVHAVDLATRRIAATLEDLDRRGVADRVLLDFGLLRDLDYYTGAILEVYDPALGHVLGGGGRYDELLGRFGEPRPAVGFALYVERLHLAQAEEGRLEESRGGKVP